METKLTLNTFTRINHMLSGTLVEDCITGARASLIQVTEKPNQDKVQVIPISCIIAKCVYIDVTDFADRSFVIPFPNRVEKD